MNTRGFTTNDTIHLRQFNEWRYGQYYHPAERNEVIRELGFTPQSRSHFEIFKKALEFFKIAELKAARDFFRVLADKHRQKYIYAN